MNPIVTNLQQFQNIPTGYNPLLASINRDPLEITNFSDSYSGYNIVVPSIDLENISIYSIPGIDNVTSSLKVGINTSTILVGGLKSTTQINSKITEINSQIITIGLNTATNIGNISTPFANITTLNTSTANIKVNHTSTMNASIANIKQLNASRTSISELNASLANISVMNTSYILANNMTCYNLSAYNVRQCHALWYTTQYVSPDRIIGNVSLNIIQTSIVNNASSLDSKRSLFLCSYDGMYACSVTVTPLTNIDIVKVYVKKTSNAVDTFIGPIIYGNTGNQIASLSGSITLFCNSGDLLGFYNRGTAIAPGNVSMFITENDQQFDGDSAQMCSITLL